MKLNWLVALLVITLLAACSNAGQPAVSTETPSPLPSETSPTATLLPTETPEPLVERVIFVPAPDVEAGLAARVQTALEELAGASGLPLEISPELQVSDLDAGAKLVVSLGRVAPLAEWATAFPGVQFLAVEGSSDLPELPNLSLISSQDLPADQQGFMAGVLAAAITRDWRVAVLGIDQAGADRAAWQGFLQGVRYACGLCRPAYPPYPGYPLYIALPPQAGLSDWQAAVDVLLNQENGVQTFYLAPGVAVQGLAQYLADKGAWIIGSTPAPDALQARWAASVLADPLPLLEELVPELLAGQGGFQRSASLGIQPGNPELYSPARQRVVNLTLQEMLAGAIDTGVDPATGDRR